ncbi:MAG: TIGR01906 family membrane protein [Chloroflexi bacterium]|nr:TIGR01906 family membrane protein [Chloroflexota bacterium]
MKALALISFVLFLLAMPLLFFSTAVGVVSGNLSLYQWGFERHGVAEDLGIEPGEMEEAARGLLAYFNSPLEPVGVLVRGEELFNEIEKVHLRDVKGLLVLDRRVQAGALAYILAFVAGNWIWRRKTFWESTLRALRWGSGLTLSLILMLGLAAVAGFDRLFLAFHLVSFSNPFWQLDPARDKLIVMFPEGFFYDITLVIFGATALMALALGTASHLLLRLKFARR